jgi:hypothetical protein
MKAGDVRKVEPILSGLIHNSIVNSVNFVVQKCSKIGNAPQEPDFIAALTLKFTPDLFNILKTVFTNAKFTVTSVFCHQKPLADIGVGKNPEIGDILFVYIYSDNTRSKKFNSILFQAKISTKLTTTISKADEHQLKLYSEWPTFKYKKAGKLNGVTRDILPKTINDGAQYLLIDNHPYYGLAGVPGTFPMGCATPAKTLSINNDLASELIDFIRFKSGRPFEENNSSSKDDWSRMIWDILIATKDKASKRKNAGLSKFARQSTNKFDGCCFYMSETNSIYRDLHERLLDGNAEDGDNFFDEDSFATSVVVIESNEEAEG